MPSLKASTETSACFWISLRSRLARAHARSNAAVVGHHASCPFLRTLRTWDRKGSVGSNPGPRIRAPGHAMGLHHNFRLLRAHVDHHTFQRSIRGILAVFLGLYVPFPSPLGVNILW